MLSVKNKLVTVLLISATILLTGCAKVSPENLFTGFREHVGVAYTETIELDMAVDVSGKTERFDVDIESKIYAKGDTTRIISKVSSLGVEETIDRFLIKDKMYRGFNDSWFAEDVDAISYHLEPSFVKSFVNGDKLPIVIHNDEECYEVTAKIPLAALNKDLEAIFGQIDLSGNADATYYFSKKNENLVGISLDLTDKVRENLLKSVQKKIVGIDAKEHLNIEKCLVKITDIITGNPEDIPIPIVSGNERPMEEFSKTLIIEQLAKLISEKEISYIIWLSVYNNIKIGDTSLVLGESKVKDYISAGLKIDEPEKMIKPNESESIVINNKSIDITLETLNTSKEESKLEELNVYKIMIREDKKENITLAGFGIGTKETELIKKFREPTERIVDNKKIKYVWLSEQGNKIEATIKDGSVSYIEISLEA